MNECEHDLTPSGDGWACRKCGKEWEMKPSSTLRIENRTDSFGVTMTNYGPRDEKETR